MSRVVLHEGEPATLERESVTPEEVATVLARTRRPDVTISRSSPGEVQKFLSSHPALTHRQKRRLGLRLKKRG